jgi:ABC-type multidrug transport system fused ATPase/permease subunit
MWDDQGPTEEGHIRRLSLLDMVRRIRPRLGPHRRTFLLAIVLMLLSVATDLSGPLILRRLIDGVIPAAMKDGQIGGILLTAGLYLGLFLVGAAAAYAQALLVARLGLSLVTKLKRDTFEHLLNLGMDYFDANPPGRLMARVESDAERLQMLFSEVALAMARSFLLLAGTLTVMFLTGWKITLGLVGLLLPVIVGGLFFLRFLRRVYATVRRLFARLTTFVTEYVQAVPILQVFGRTAWTMEKLRVVNRERYHAEKRAAFFEYGFWSFFSSLEVVAVMLILRLGFGTAAVVAGMTLGTLVLFVEYTRRLFFPLLMFAEQIQFLQRAFASADRVFGILSTESTVADAPGTSDRLPRDWKTLSFDRVTFDYAEGSRALEEVSFTVRRGETVALAGPSGGGKTTVTSLLLRFYEPSSGAILLDDVDIRRFSLSTWRDAIGLVLQDIHLFPGTVGDNLRVFADGIPDERLAGAISSLGAEEILSRLSRGLGTDLAEGGQNLSMGERQLLSFARALVRDPQILILDEATSSVDPGTERKLQESVERLRRGRTSLVVAHRLSTITAADRILVLQRGRLVEEGTHRELYERDGIYRGLFDLQFEAGEVAS